MAAPLSLVFMGTPEFAATILDALIAAGHHIAAVYDGSWSEWGLPDGPPIETGPAKS